MRTLNKTRKLPIALLTLAALVSTTAASRAGELTVTWPSAGPASETAYRVYVGERPGEYDRVVDAGSAIRATIRDLEDDKIHFLAVKAYDRMGHESPSFSPELACLAGPRVDRIEPSSLSPGAQGWVTLVGANFDSEIQVRSRDPRVRARSAVFAGAGRVKVLIEAVAEGHGGPVIVVPAMFTLINPCRKAESFFESHPEVTDLDGSGRVDSADVDGIRDAFGSHRGDVSYAASADLDGDGSVDGRDLARVTASVGADLHQQSSSSPRP